MAKVVTKGVGLMRRKVVEYSLEDDPDAFMPGGALDEWFSKKPQTADEYREANANHVRAQLAKAYAKMDPTWFCRNSPDQTENVRSDMAHHPQGFVAGYFGEDHAYAIMQEWLNWYDRLAAERAKPDPNIPLVVEISEELGRLYERLYWRAGVDPKTRTRREVLALQARESRLARPRATERRREKAAKRRFGGDQAPDDKLAWRREAIEHAREVRSRHPTYAASRVAKEMAPSTRYGDGSSRAWRQTLEVIKFLWG